MNCAKKREFSSPTSYSSSTPIAMKMKRTPPRIRPSTFTRSHSNALIAEQQQNADSPTHPPQNVSAVANVETHNPYDSLSDKDDGDDLNDILSKSTRPNKRSARTLNNTTHLDKKPKNETISTNKMRPPPLTAPSLSRVAASNFLANLVDGKNFQIRMSNDGIKLYAPSIESFIAAKNKLVESDIKFYTHTLKDEQTSKYVLNGFYKTDINDVIAYLNEVGVKPLKVNNIAIRNKRFDDHALYVVHFLKKDRIKLSYLRENASVINSVRITWDYFKSKRNGPIQCTNCMQYGHGSASCFLSPMCVRCGGNHLSKDCQLIMNVNSTSVIPRIPVEQLKCGLCGQNHAANYVKCESRLRFIDRQIHLRNQNQAKNNKKPPLINQRKHNFAPASDLINANFPSINIENAANGLAWSQPNSQHHPNLMTFNNNDLFTPPELMAIMKDMTSKLRPCKTKEEQIFVLWEIVTNYVYGSK